MFVETILKLLIMEKIIEHLSPRVLDYVNSDTDECILFKTVGSDGYGDIQYCINKIHAHAKAHRIVYQVKHNVVLSNNEIIMHSCDNPACCNPRHLSAGSHKDNSNDKVSKGRQAKGKTNGRYTHGRYSKYEPTQKPIPLFKELFGRSLCLEDVVLIKTTIQNRKDVSLQAISKELGVKHQTVKDIYYGRAYQGVTI